MKKVTLIAIGGLLAVSTASLGYAQSPTSQTCSSVQPEFVAAMEQFRAAYFERDDALGTAESIMVDEVLPNAERMYRGCPDTVVATVRNGVEAARASLNDPNRTQLIKCDQALITYQKLLSKFDNTTLAGGYNTYRNLLYRDIDPSAQAAVEACPQMTDLSRETRVTITERQRRLDRMEDMDSFGSSMADDITSNADYLESLEDDE